MSALSLRNPDVIWLTVDSSPKAINHSSLVLIHWETRGVFAVGHLQPKGHQRQIQVEQERLSYVNLKHARSTGQFKERIG